MPEHNSGIYVSDEKNAIQVQAINFAELIKDRLNSYKLIVIKMDIEGGEYEVLDHLLDQGLFESIHSIFCEFHSQYMNDEEKIRYKTKEANLVASISKTPSKFNLWI